MPVTIELTFQGPVEKTVLATHSVLRDFSKSRGGSIALSVNDALDFDRFEWYVGGYKAATGNNIQLMADMKVNGNDVFRAGLLNRIAVFAYVGDTPWSAEFSVFVSE